MVYILYAGGANVTAITVSILVIIVTSAVLHITLGIIFYYSLRKRGTKKVGMKVIHCMYLTAMKSPNSFYYSWLYTEQFLTQYMLVL